MARKLRHTKLYWCIRYALGLLLLCTLAGCPLDKATRPAQPPTIVEVPVKVYVPIDPELTEPCPIATGTLEQIPQVARARRKALEDCNADKAAIRKVQGKPVPKTEAAGTK